MAKKVIALKGQPILNEDGVAGEAITPGHLVKGVDTILKHATAGGVAMKNFAMERDEMGKTIDDAYAINDTVKVGSFHAGMRVNALIASGQNITKDDFMESAGNGTLRKFASGTILGRALETTGAVTATTRLTVEII